MTKRIEWTTPGGTKVELALLTSKTTNADGHKIETPCYELRAWLPGPGRLLSDLSIVESPANGPCLRDGCARVSVPIAPEVRDAVIALVDEYRAEKQRRLDEWIKGEREYDAHRKRMARPGCPDDPNAI